MILMDDDGVCEMRVQDFPSPLFFCFFFPSSYSSFLFPLCFLLFLFFSLSSSFSFFPPPHPPPPSSSSSFFYYFLCAFVAAGTPRKFDEFQTEARNKLRLLMASVNRNQKKGVPPVVVVVNIGASDQQLPELPLYQQALAQLVQTECQPAANETVWVDVSNREQVIKSFFPALVKVWEQTCVLFPRHRTDMRERLAVFKKQAGILNTLVHVDEDFACGEVYPFEASNSPFLNCAQLCLELKLPVDQGLSRSKADWRAVIAQLAETGDIIILPHDSATIGWWPCKTKNQGEGGGGGGGGGN